MTRTPGTSQTRHAARRVAVAGVVSALLLASYVGYWERRAARGALRERAGERVELLATTLRASMQVLDSLQSLHAAMGGLQRDTFLRFASDARHRHPELRALEWAPRVDAAGRASFEAGFPIVDIDDRGTRQPAGPRASYFPVQWIEPLAGNEAAQGLDLARDARRGEALARAGSTGRPAATAPLRLAQEPEDQPGFLVLLPLSVADGRIDGFAVAVFRAGDLVGHAMRDMGRRGIGFTISDVTSTAPARIFGDSVDAGFAASTWSQSLDVGGRRWQVAVASEPGAWYLRLPWQAALVLAAGLIVTGLLAQRANAAAQRSREIADTNAALTAEAAGRERAVQAAQEASRSKSDFLAHMSHEIRTPMNAILGHAQWLRRDARLERDQREAVTTIIASGNHLIAQINEVLDFSKIESLSLELRPVDTDLNELLPELERLFRARCRERRLSLKLQLLPAEAAWVRVDPVKLQQVLTNLLGNAVRFTNVGEVALLASVSGSTWRFDVSDTGSGIAAVDLERIFEPFQQVATPAAAEGSGLGLAIARRLAGLMGGQLAVASEPGIGSVFSLTLPLERATALKGVDAAPEAPGPHYASLRVPDALWQRMATAAELHSATVLKQCLAELEALGPNEASFAAVLREPLRSYDMHGVARMLTHVVPS